MFGQLSRYADQVERLIASKRVETHQDAVAMVAAAGEIKQLLNVLNSIKTGSTTAAARTEALRSLIERYRALEGTLKELRNDLPVDTGERVRS